MNSDAIGRTTGPGIPIVGTTVEEKNEPLTASEKGRCQILAGWIITMIGIAGYIVAMSGAPENADMIDALASQGLLGWGSLSVLLTGVIVWVRGNVSLLNEISETP